MDYSKGAVIEELSTRKLGIIRSDKSRDSWMVEFEGEAGWREVPVDDMRIVPEEEVGRRT